MAFIRAMPHRQALVWGQMARWAIAGALLAVGIAALNANSKAIEYMNAQAQLKIAEGIAAGKVNTIVVPYDFKGIVNANAR